MCGIGGFFSNAIDSLPAESVQRSVLDHLKQRGPDASGVWQDPGGSVVLLHTRLSIQDLTPTGAQPMVSADGSAIIVFNGEIYNAHELRTWLPEYPFRGTSDTEVLLAMYKRYGRECLQFLRGMFAFAIWDRNEESLFLARDPYGIKPLYLAETPTGLWFSSQVKSLLALKGIDRSPEPAGHVGFFLWGSVPEPYTLYKGIRSLRSGHSLLLRRGSSPVETRFASIAASLLQGPDLSPDKMPLAHIGDAVTSAVRDHFLADVPVGVFLSAGLDSSTILAAAASQFDPQTLHALTLGFDAYRGTENDETVLASEIARYYGVSHRVDTIRKEDFQAEAEHFLAAMDQPTIDGINTYFVARMAREAGYKVALSGVGGDELFGGYDSFRQIPTTVNLVSGLRVSRRFGGSVRRATEALARRFTSPKFAGVLEYGGSMEGAYLLRRSLYMPWELPEILGAELAAEGLEQLEQSEQSDEEFKELRNSSQHVQVCFLESTRYMRNQLLRDADWAGMAHSLEIRTPLVDSFLLTQMAGLLRSSQPPTKLDMARSVPKPPPEAILGRKKTGFVVPVRTWLSESMPGTPERGLRSWAKLVYSRQWTGSSE
jgi:asparagine synthase (glutamine-hydrolysing)